MKICKLCQSEIPAFGLTSTHDYCAVCRSCQSCGKQLSELELESAGRTQEFLCDQCLGPKIKEDIITRKRELGQDELDWLNRVRMMLEPNLELSPDTNVENATIAAEASLSVISSRYANSNDSVDEVYIRLKRLEAIVAVYSVAIKHRRAEIKQRITKVERTKYESAMTQSQQDVTQQCPKCKKPFPERAIASHIAWCKADLTIGSKIKLQKQSKLVRGFMDSLGMSETEALEYAKEIQDKQAAKATNALLIGKDKL